MKKRMIGLVALVSLAACLLVPMLFYFSVIWESAMKTGFALVSVVWFVAATWWGRRKV